MKNEFLLKIICLYLTGVPIITTLNGLSMHLTGISAVGPAYHTAFTIAILAAGLASPRVQKNPIVVFGAFILVTLMIGVQCALGLSDVKLLDLGVLYKWLMPILLLAVYYRWDYLRGPEAGEKLSKVFRTVPLIYSGLIVLSCLTWLAFGFNPTVFDPGSRERFVGFAWGYNPTVNAFFVCAYLNFLRLRTPVWMRIVLGSAFFLLLSKTAVVYFSLIGLSFVLPYLRNTSSKSRWLVVAGTLPVLTISAWFGYQQTVRSADLFQVASRMDVSTADLLAIGFAGGRFTWWQYVIEDAESWPTENLIFGNGTNVDRRAESPLWGELIAVGAYKYLAIDKTTKTLEQDMIGHFDLFGLLGVLVFAAVFYVYPLFAIRQPFFRPYYLMLIVFGLFGGHMLNDPQVTSLLVFFLVYLRFQVRAPRTVAAVPVRETRPHEHVFSQNYGLSGS